MEAAQDAILFGEDNPWKKMSMADLISFLGQPDKVEIIGTTNSTLSTLHYVREQKDYLSPDRKWRRIDYQFCFDGQRMYDSRWDYEERFSKTEYTPNNYLLTNPFLDITPTNIVAVTFKYRIWGISDRLEPTTDSLSLAITNTEEIVSLCTVAAKLKNCDPLPTEVGPCACGFSAYATIDFWQRTTETDGQSSPSTIGDAAVSISLCSSPHSLPNTRQTVVLLSEHEDFKDKRITSSSEELT